MLKKGRKIKTTYILFFFEKGILHMDIIYGLIKLQWREYCIMLNELSYRKLYVVLVNNIVYCLA